MAFLAIATAVTSMATGIAQTIKGKKQADKAKRKAEEFQYPELRNTIKGIATPQLAYNQREQQIERTAADAYSTLALAGSRGMQMAGGVMDSTTAAKQQNVAQYEQSLFDMALQQAKENMTIRAMQEERARIEMQGISSQINAGNQTMTSGLQNAIGGLSGLAGSIGGGGNSKSPISDRSIAMTTETINTPIREQVKFGIQ